ncbi:MAG: hypothetical protein AMXMBFR6_25980 [Betaproteobacteria bacterium]
MLTDSQCRSAKCKDKPYKLTDANGLYREVMPNGVKAWRYRFKLTKAGETKENLFAIGDYASAPPGETAEEAKTRSAGGRFTLAEARDERAKARALVKQGINPCPSSPVRPPEARARECHHLRGHRPRMAGPARLGGGHEGPTPGHAATGRLPENRSAPRKSASCCANSTATTAISRPFPCSASCG